MADSQRYLVTARKYRPKLFREVVAQEHVTDTLKNALRLDRLAHAYLFSGPRGVGKTTSARILAKAINCETPREDREDGAEPCCECDSCRSFEDGRSMNVFEMDAASNNKVDDIRELRETVRIPPQGSTKKVYILDEVHMLSTAAFNALLKTLEEPPPHALFIFATTEPHKVLPTILSRCQRFDFRRIPVPNMVSHLREICEVEDINADEESLMLLARKGDGALRDALSAFDQAISLCGTTIEYGELTQALGVVDQELFFQLTDHVAERSTGGVLKLVHHVVRNGFDLNEFLSGVAEHLRNLLVAQSLGAEALEDVAASTQKRYVGDSKQFSEADLLRLLMITGEAEEDVKNTSQPRLKLEMALLKMASITQSADLRRVLRKIERLEKMVDEGEIPEDLPLGNGRSAADTSPNPSATDGSAPPENHADDPSANRPKPGTSSQVAEPDAEASYAASAGQPSGGAPAQAPTEDTAPSTGSTHDRSSSEGPAADNEETPPNPPEPSPPSQENKPSENKQSENKQSQSASQQNASAPDTSPPNGSTQNDDEDDDPPGGIPEDPSGDGSGDGSGSGQGGMGYNDLFGTPALKKASPSGSGSQQPEDQAGTATAPASAAPASSGDASASGVPAPPEARPAAPSAEDEAAVRGLADVWPTFIKTVKADRISLGTQLAETNPVGFDNGVAQIGVPDNLTRDRLRDRHTYLREMLVEKWDVEIDSLRFVVRENGGEEDTSSSSDKKMPLDPHEMLAQLRERYPTIDTLVNEFGAEPSF